MTVSLDKKIEACTVLERQDIEILSNCIDKIRTSLIEADEEWLRRQALLPAESREVYSTCALEDPILQRVIEGKVQETRRAKAKYTVELENKKSYKIDALSSLDSFKNEGEDRILSIEGRIQTERSFFVFRYGEGMALLSADSTFSYSISTWIGAEDKIERLILTFAASISQWYTPFRRVPYLTIASYCFGLSLAFVALTDDTLTELKGIEVKNITAAGVLWVPAGMWLASRLVQFLFPYHMIAIGGGKGRLETLKIIRIAVLSILGFAMTYFIIPFLGLSAP